MNVFSHTNVPEVPTHNHGPLNRAMDPSGSFQWHVGVRTLQWHTPDSELETALRPWFEGWFGSSVKSPDFWIQLSYDELAGSLTDATEEGVETGLLLDDQALILVSNHTLISRPRSHQPSELGVHSTSSRPPYRFEVCFETRCLNLVVHPDWHQTPMDLYQWVIDPLLCNLVFPFLGMKTLHGALLRHPSTHQVWVVMGYSGQGKTTLALHLARAGFELFTDDHLLLCQTPSGLWLEASPYPMKLTDETLAMFPEFEPHRIGVSAFFSEKNLIRHQAVYPSHQHGVSVQDVVLVVLEEGSHLPGPERKACDATRLVRYFNEKGFICFRSAAFEQLPAFFEQILETHFSLTHQLLECADGYVLFNQPHPWSLVKPCLEPLWT